MAEERRYKRRTTRKVDVLMHTQMPGRPNNTACGLWKYEHPLAPQVFEAGDVRPDRVVVECPLCQAALACKPNQPKGYNTMNVDKDQLDVADWW